MENQNRIHVVRLVIINLLIILFLIACLEGASRIFLHFFRGSSTIGLPERTQYLSYQPFVMFGRDWDSFLSPSKYEYDHHKHIQRVLLIGGSTAALFPTDVLEAALRKKFPSYEFQVINAAEGGYNARQEVIVAAMWAPALKPNIIITLDGANDLIHRIRMDKAGTFYLDNAYAVALKKPFIAPFADILRHSQLVQGMQRLGERIKIAGYENYTDAIPVYISAEHSINTIAKGLSAIRLIVLQPYNVFKKPMSPNEAAFTSYRYRENVVTKLYDLLNEQLKNLAKTDGAIYLDSRAIYNGNTATIFSDDVHFVNTEGYKILAENIANCLDEKNLKESNPSP